MEASYTNLKAWQHGYNLTLQVYKVTAGFPVHEKYGLTSQMQRSSSSVPCNIAEGYARVSQKEKVQFYSTARGSLAELQTQLMLCRDIGYLESTAFDELFAVTTETYKTLNGLIKAIQRSIKP